MSNAKVECIDCDGTGLIEGQEWNGEKCRTCHGTGWVDDTEIEEALEREPPEPDGECFRGGEAASYSAEQQARIQRELK